MPVVILQGIRGGTGTTSLTAALGWALNALGESVLAVDFSPDNQLAAHFNTPLDDARGWMHALLHGDDWQQSALRYQPGLDFLPFGQLTHQQRSSLPAFTTDQAAPLLHAFPALQRRYQWLLLDMPAETLPWHDAVSEQANCRLQVLTADANCHLRLHHLPVSRNSRFLINQFNANSKLQQDLHQLWISSLNNLIPLVIHRDEAMAEALMMKQPTGEYRPHALVSEEMTTLANWLILHIAGVRE